MIMIIIAHYTVISGREKRISMYELATQRIKFSIFEELHLIGFSTYSILQPLNFIMAKRAWNVINRKLKQSKRD